MQIQLIETGMRVFRLTVSGRLLLFVPWRISQQQLDLAPLGSRQQHLGSDFFLGQLELFPFADLGNGIFKPFDFKDGFRRGNGRNGHSDGGDGPVVNPSGGLISKGHPLGATGLAQCSELTWQLRGQAEKRQVDDVDVALQHNIGLGGAAVVSIYRRAR